MRHVLALAIAAIITVAACGATSSPPPDVTSSIRPSGEPTAQPSGATAQIDRIRVALNGRILGVDGHAAVAADAQVAYLLQGQLFRYDVAGNPQPDLVETHETSEDGLTQTMVLYEGLTFSDGTPLTAEDVVFSFEVAQSHPSVPRALVDGMTATAADRRTVVFTLPAPEPALKEWLAGYWGWIHPKAQVESLGDAYWQGTTPVSAGPYKLKTREAGADSVFLEENPTYKHGPVAIKEIELVYIADLTARALQFVQGDLDYVHDLPAASAGSFPSEVRTWGHLIGGVFFLHFNEQPSPEQPCLLDRDVREAISLAIDRDRIANQVFFGLTKRTGSILPRNMSERVETLPNDGARDLEGARARLAASSCPQGFQFSIITQADRPGWRDAVVVIQENLAELGITVVVDAFDSPTANAMGANHQYQARWGGNAFSGPARTHLGNYYLVNGTIAGWSGYDSPTMRALFDRLVAEPTEAGRLSMFEEIQRQGYVDMPMTPLVDRVILSGSRIPSASSPGEGAEDPGLFVVAAGRDVFVVYPVGG
jgi:peptide/nickel transport system substrate-binding protein